MIATGPIRQASEYRLYANYCAEDCSAASVSSTWRSSAGYVASDKHLVLTLAGPSWRESLLNLFDLI